MKTISATTLAMALVLALGTATAQPANPAKGSASSPAACCMDPNAQMSQMDEHMQLMHALHEKMASASPEERQKLMAEQRQEMQQGMAMMQQMRQGGAMMGGAMMGGGAKGGMMSQKGKRADQMTQKHMMMEKRMDMMQMMMQSMMDQQGASGGAMTPAPAK